MDSLAATQPIESFLIDSADAVDEEFLYFELLDDHGFFLFEIELPYFVILRCARCHLPHSPVKFSFCAEFVLKRIYLRNHLICFLKVVFEPKFTSTQINGRP